jgi:thiamine biosynthesis protein ThiC
MPKEHLGLPDKAKEFHDETLPQDVRVGIITYKIAVHAAG